MPSMVYFAYYGPNRRLKVPAIEVRLDFSRDSKPVFRQDSDTLARKFEQAGISGLIKEPGGPELFPDPDLALGEQLVQIASVLQQATGHQVRELDAFRDPFDEQRVIALVEHQHADVGIAAVQLAANILVNIEFDLLTGWKKFQQAARSRLPTTETKAIICAAARLSIPVLQPENPPLFQSMAFEPPLRPNSLLLVGQGSNTCWLEGCFRRDRADDYIRALRRNPGLRRKALQELQPGTADTAPGTTHSCKLLMIGGEPALVLQNQSGDWYESQEVPLSALEGARSIQEKAGGQVVLVSAEIPASEKPTKLKVVFTDFELAPDLAFLKSVDGGDALLDKVAEALLRSIYPSSHAARLPVVSITGTNGKTTVTRMTAHILSHAEMRVGFVTSEGVMINGQQVTHEDAGAYIGHVRVLTDPGIDAAVLETHHRGIAVRGFAFDHCDVGVCLNVTADHIKPGEIASIDEMATIKAAVPAMASGAAVLFADDDYCRAMAPGLRAKKLWWVSLRESAAGLAAITTTTDSAACLVEIRDGREWIVFHQQGVSTPIVAVDDIPATFSGAARFMVSNAMHAAVAAFELGVAPTVIAAALQLFRADPSMTPGRLNEFTGLPFRLIADFAHNPDGLTKISQFASQLEVPGRKIIAFAGMAKRDDAINRLSARAVAGNFDFYICKEYTPEKPPLARLVAPLMQQVLIESGVHKEDTMVTGYGADATLEILHACRPGDLLILLIGNSEKRVIHQWIEAFEG